MKRWGLRGDCPTADFALNSISLIHGSNSSCKNYSHSIRFMLEFILITDHREVLANLRGGNVRECVSRVCQDMQCNQPVNFFLTNCGRIPSLHEHLARRVVVGLNFKLLSNHNNSRM